MNKNELGEALECTIEDLEGEHEGKIVVGREVFNALWEAARKYHAIQSDLDALFKIFDKGSLWTRGMKVDGAANRITAMKEKIDG